MPRPASERRVIRIFISSTFRDMQAEREELVKRVLPQVRRLCEQRGVTFGEVDLRWGVTDEQKAEGRVLPICLREIELSRPYFIGLLGERYGWVPDEIPADVRVTHPWIDVDKARSVTELEILHGVLNDPDMQNHAFFYLRDPAYVETLPAVTRDDFVDADPEHRAKLATLKDRIRTSGFPVHDGYSDPRALGELLLADLTTLVDRLYPGDARPDPLDREAAAHAAYAASRFGSYVAREGAFAELDTHAAGDGPPLVVLGESGSGKSALLANWVQRYRGSPEGHDALVVEHYVGASPESADFAAMLRRIMSELSRRFSIRDKIPDDPKALREAFGEFLRRAGSAGRVVLVLDGLNQLEDRDGAPDLVWLPIQLPKTVRLVLSTLSGRPLEALQHRRADFFEVTPLSDAERRTLIRNFLARFSKALSVEHEDRLAGAAASENPLFLRTVLDELRQHGDHFTLGEVLDHYLASPSTADLFDRVLARYERDYERDCAGLVRASLTALWAARRGLSEVELLDVLGSTEPLPHAIWSPLFLAAEQSLVTRSGLFNLGHDYLRKAVQTRYLPDQAAQRAAHGCLADAFARAGLGPRQVDELPWQLSRAARWDDLATRLRDLAFFQAVYAADVRDAQRYWARLESESPHRMASAYRPVLDDAGGRDPQLLWALAVVMMFAGHLDEAIALQRVLVHTFREAGLKQQLQESLTNLAAMLGGRDMPEDVVTILTETEQLARERGDLAGVASALGGQGRAKWAQNDYDGALSLLQEEERISREIADLAGVQRSLGNQGGVLLARADFDTAMERFLEQERICRQLGDTVALQNSLAGQADVLGTRGDLKGALSRLRDREQFLRELGDVASLQRCLGRQATYLAQLGRYDDALACSAEQERICRQSKYRSELLSCLLSRAQLLEQRGELDAALPLLDETTRLAEELDDLNGLAGSLGVRARVLRARGRLEDALTMMQQEERIYRKLDKLHGVEGSLGNQAQVLLGLGRTDEALAAAREAERIDRELGIPTQLQAAVGTQGLIQLERGELDEALRLFQVQERMCRELDLPNALQACLGNQAVILYRRGDIAGALARYGDQESLCRKLGLRAVLQQNLLNQATLLREAFSLQQALTRYHEHEQLCRELGEQGRLACSLLAQAEILTAAGHASAALVRYQEIVDLCRAAGDDQGLRGALAMCATLLANTGQLDAAIPLFAESEQLCRAAGDLKAMQRCIGNRATVHIGRREFDEAARLLDEQVAICRQLDDKEGLQAGLGNQAIVAKERGDLEGSLALLGEQEHLCREIGNAQGLVIAVANRGEVLVAAARVGEGIAALTAAEDMARQLGLVPMATQIRMMLRKLSIPAGVAG
jgi:tetratricopeptide (TPR) repeat protein